LPPTTLLRTVDGHDPCYATWGMRIAALLCLLLVFTGCVTPPSQEEIASMDFGPPPQNHVAVIKVYFEDILFDPYSAKYEFGEPQQYWYKEPPLAGGKLYLGHSVKAWVNAKNRYGGYVGKKPYMFIIRNEQIIKVVDELQLQTLKEVPLAN